MDDFAAAGGDPDDPQQVLSLIMDMLGPIDPDSHNGWLLKAAAGEPYYDKDNRMDRLELSRSRGVYSAVLQRLSNS